MNQLEAFNRLLSIIKNNERHEYYAKTVKMAEDYEAYSTNEHLDEKLHRLNSRQTDEAFAEQKAVTIHICKSITASLTHIFYRVPDSQAIKTTWTPEDEEFKTAMRDYTRDGLENFLRNRVKNLIELDPNAWIVNETTGTDGRELATVYPYIVESENAIMYEYEHSKLLYLVDWRDDETALSKNGNLVQVQKWTIYTDEGVVKVMELPDNAKGIDLTKVTEVTEFPEVFNLGRKSYMVEVPLPYNLEQVPARCVGYSYHKEYDDIYVNMYDACVPFLDKIIKANSESDIAYTKHVHPQKIQYVRACTHGGCHVEPDGKYYIDYLPEGSDEYKQRLCPSCKGLGRMDTSTTGVEAILLPFPNDKADILDLTNIVHYIAVDINTPEALNKYVDHCIMLCRKIIFNQEDLTLEDMARQRTATELIINDSNRDDTLKTYAQNYVKLYEFLIKTSAGYMDKKIEVIAEVSRDFNMRGLPEWTNILQALTTAGANEFIINSVQWEILRSLHGQSDATMEYSVRSKLIPFSMMSKEQKALTISSLPPKDPYRIALLYGEAFITELINDESGFLLMNYKKQKELFDKKVEERITKLTEQEPKMPAFPDFTQS